jgi:indole-3-glycerol phosphate synthase
MQALVETHDRAEVERALAADARVIGVNHRDLRTFEMDMTLAATMRPLVPSDRLLVAESGIRTADDAKRMQAAGVDAILVGEALMREPDPGAGLRRLLGGA